MTNRQEFFESVYRNNLWGSDESRSGQGSALWYTKRLIEALPPALRELGVSRLLDVPCGDFNWMKEVDLSGVDYIGGDIVPELVESNTAAYGSPSRRFMALDIVSDALPAADLIFIRDCFIHFSNDLVFQSLENIAKSDIKYLCVSSISPKFHPDVINFDLDRTQAGVNFEFRPIQFRSAPFSFPPPVLELADGIEGTTDWHASMTIWEVETVRQVLKSRA